MRPIRKKGVVRNVWGVVPRENERLGRRQPAAKRVSRGTTPHTHDPRPLLQQEIFQI